MFVRCTLTPDKCHAGVRVEQRREGGFRVAVATGTWAWQLLPQWLHIYQLYYLLLLQLLLTTNTNTQEEEDARVWWNHVPYSYPHPAYGENDWRWSFDQWPQQCFFFTFPCKFCINLIPYLSGVHGLSQADVDLVINKAKRVVEGSKAAMVRLTFNDRVGKSDNCPFFKCAYLNGLIIVWYETTKWNCDCGKFPLRLCKWLTWPCLVIHDIITLQPN